MEGAISISRNSGDTVIVSITDRVSGVRFVEIELSLEAFAQAITGLAYVGGDLSVRGLDKVGRSVEIECREATCPILTYDKGVLASWLLENAAEDGWEIDTYLGSQGSVRQEGGMTILRYKIRRYTAKATP